MKQARTQVSKSFMQKPAEVDRQWHLVDVKGQILGRIATEIAEKLMGKHKPSITPHVDGGDYVVVINAEQVATTGDKTHKKIYYSHTGFPGGLNEKTLGEIQAKFPERIIEKAVYNMLPKNRLRQHRMVRLKVYAGEQHPHHSQLGLAAPVASSETKE
jgi:large subunit ribosomal protein L13